MNHQFTFLCSLAILIALSFQATAQVKNFEKLVKAEATVESCSFNDSIQSRYAPSFYKDGILFSTDSGDEKIGFTTVIKYAEKGEKIDFYNPKDPFKKSRKHSNVSCTSFAEESGELFFTANHQKVFTDSLGNSVLNLSIYALDSAATKLDAEPLTFCNPEYNFIHPSINKAGDMLIFASDLNGEGHTDLYISHKIAGNWIEPSPLEGAVNSKGRELFPHILNDSTLLFSSDGQIDSLGGLDIYYAERHEGIWQEPILLQAPFNSTFNDFGMIYDETSRSGFFCSRREDFISDQIFRFIID